MMNIVGNQIIHEAADHYGWKEGSTEKLLLHGMWGAEQDTQAPIFTNNYNSFVMNSLYNILPIDDYRRENIKFDQFDAKVQGDNLEQANHLVAEVYK